MRRSFLAVFVLAAAACVDVPDSVRAQFAGPGAADRTNYRPGNHGSAPPVEEPPAPKAAEAAVSGAPLEPGALAADAGAAEPSPAAAAEDGGAS